MSLKKRTFSGLYWTLTQQVSSQLIHFVVSVILARILMPAEFGLIGMIGIVIAVGNILRDGGMSSSLIRTEQPTQEDYSTVFIVNLITSIVVYLLAFMAAPWVADFFDQQELTAIIRISTLTFIIGALSTIQLARLTRIMDFKTQMIVQIPSLIAGGLLGVFLAWRGFGVWSLVWMSIFQSSVSTIQLWIRSKWWPELHFSKSVFKKHFSFGYRLMLSGVIDAVYQNIYHIVIGRFFSPSQLGLYTRALTLRQLPVQNISNALRKVTLPMFASIQTDDARLKHVSKKLMTQVIFWVAPILIGLSVVAEPFFRLLFTEKWLAAVPYFRLLCVAGILFPVHSYNLNILNVKGRSDLFLKIEIVKKILITIGVIVAIPFGIYGLLYAQIILTLINFVINSWYSDQFINYSIKEQVLDIAPIVGLALISGVITWSIDWTLTSLSLGDLIRLICGITVYSGSYLGISYLVGFESLKDFREFIIKR